MTLPFSIVPGTDGTPDRAASQAALTTAFNQAFDKLEADRSLQTETIAKAVSEYLGEQPKGKFVQVQTIANQVATLKLNSQNENHPRLVKAIHEYLKANSQKGDATSLFLKRGGAGGGLANRADVPVEITESTDQE
jgi:hypothetical protein